jgi:hypothetical protein
MPTDLGMLMDLDMALGQDTGLDMLLGLDMAQVTLVPPIWPRTRHMEIAPFRFPVQQHSRTPGPRRHNQ